MWPTYDSFPEVLMKIIMLCIWISGNVQKYTQKNGPLISACTVQFTSCLLRGEMREMLAVTYDPPTVFMY